jgi:heme b synthase
MLSCKHCRAAAQATPYHGELSTEECFRVLDNIASFAKPIIILTGGEPMLRADIYDIAVHAIGLGLPVVMAPCGMLLDDAAAERIIRSGIKAISISLDGATAESHDAFRGVPGAFDGALRGIEAAKRAGLAFQINTTVTRHNIAELPAILDLSVRLGAKTFNPFLLVPTGRGKALADQEISPSQYEETLRWLAGQQNRGDIQIRVTCAPHYQRIIRQEGAVHPSQPVKGCMGGQSFAFISHVGKVQICGFLDIECGDLKREGFNFRNVWETSEVFLRLRDRQSYRGRCGICEFHKLCGGCRARAYAMTGDYLTEEPFCLHQPRRSGRAAASQEMSPDETDKRLLTIIQSEFPVAAEPYEVLGKRLGIHASEAMERTNILRSAGLIRRLGAVFDSRSLGYVTTLVAAKVAEDRLDAVANEVSKLESVTHNYRREHVYNLWFTLTAAGWGEVEATLDRLSRLEGVADIRAMPTENVYKIRVDFRLSDEAEPPATDRPGALTAATAANLSADQQAAVRLLQGDLPASATPFAELAAALGWTTYKLIQQVLDWQALGVIRRFGAVVRHQRLGFRANGMAVFAVPSEQINEVGSMLAELPEVSHCYRRRPFDGFPYNLFAMIHGQEQSQVRDLAADFARRAGLDGFDVLFSTKEFKKTSPRFFI